MTTSMGLRNELGDIYDQAIMDKPDSDVVQQSDVPSVNQSVTTIKVVQTELEAIYDKAVIDKPDSNLYSQAP